ncbi:hypothetical protein ACIRQY_30125 [Streptomyces sp. NPDC101490]|uniref:hypothetical protein n=1 Tax=Streptomyces sp. NPDC101490 TaxID=3366143 RepID=UPI0038192980
MHADIHFQLHTLTAAELHREAAGGHGRPGPLPATGTAPALRVRLGWTLVELGLRLATPAHHSIRLAA